METCRELQPSKSGAITYSSFPPPFLPFPPLLPFVSIYWMFITNARGTFLGIFESDEASKRR
jgi:hypothetical protein